MLPWRKLSQVPALQTGYPLDFGEHGQWYVSRPRAATNLATNPSLEIAATNYTAVSSTITRTSISGLVNRQRRSAFCLEASLPTGPNWGAYYNGFSLTSGTTYFLSFDFFGDPGYTYQTYIADNAGNRLSPIKSFVATGEWQRVWFPYPATATGTHRLYVLQPVTGTLTDFFYVDGVQIEVTRRTDYFDGDSQGWVNERADFYWTGAAHASTSVRIADCRAGGERVALKDLGFRVLAVLGGGLGGIINQVTPLAVGGAFYDDTTFAAKPLTLVGALMASGLGELFSIRDALTRLFLPDGVTEPQPFLLYFQPMDERGREAGPTIEMRAVYQGGLEGNWDNVNQERLALSFLLIDRAPFLEEGEHGARLATKRNPNLSSDYILTRSAAGVWAAMGTGLNNTPFDAARGQDGKIYVVGSFTSAGGVAGTRGIARWTGTAWEAVGSGLDNGSAYAIVVGPDGTIYIGGDFTSVSGVAATDNLAAWNGTAWTSISASITGAFVYALALDGLGRLYAGGDFSAIEGVANTARIAYRTTGGVWTAMGTGGTGGNVFAIVVMPNGDVVAGGTFTLMGGVANTVRIARWDGSAWNALSTGTPGTAVYVLAADEVGRLYAGGDFTTIGGVTTNYIALWNGVAWSALESGVNNVVRGLNFDRRGFLHVTGDFTLIGGVSLSQNYIIWSGTNWLPPDIYPNSDYQFAFFDKFAGDLYIGWESTGGQVGSVTTLPDNGELPNYDGTIPVGARFRLTGPGRLRQVRNYTTDKTLYFNLLLLTGEVAILDLSDMTQIRFESNFRALLAEIFPSSDLDFTLVPGDNSLSVFAPLDSVTASVTWRDAHRSLDAALTTNLLGN